MGAFDRLQNYSAKTGLVENSDVFDTTTDTGKLFYRIHNNGYSMYEKDEQTGEITYSELYDTISTAGNQLVNAIAGSGKTTMLTLKIIHDIVSQEVTRLQQIPNGNVVRVVDSMWVCTFLRSGAIELEESLTSWQKRLGYMPSANQISFSTLDAEFKRCLNAMGVNTPIGDNSKLHSLLCKAIDSCNITRSGAKLSKEDYYIISSIVTYCRGRLDNKKYSHPSCSDYDITPTILDLIIKQYATLRQANGIMDFDEIQELLYKYLYVTPNKAVQDFVANRYKYIYIDEFQDTSQLQYAILKFYARGKLWLNRDGDVHCDDILYTGEETVGKIIAIGDVSQCIYSFKGSDSRIIAEHFEYDFRPTNSALSVNWRCPKNILEPIVPSIHKNKDSVKQNIIASRDGGEFHLYTFSSYKTMIQQLKEEIQKDMENNRSVGILCRTNFDGIIPALSLESDKRFNFSISGENMTMNSPLPKKLIGMTSLFTERSTPSVRTSLQFFVRGGDYQIKQLLDTCKMNNMSIWQIPDEDLMYSAPSLAKFIKEVKDIFVQNGLRDKKREIEALRYIYFYMMVNVFKNDSSYATNARAYLETLLYIIDNNNFESVYEFIDEIDFLNDKLRGRVKKSKAPIHIVTVHEAKGKEWDSVYVWNDSEGVFPSSKCDLDDLEQLEEERRVHYIACTRAKKKECIYTMAGKWGMFVSEMNCVPETPTISLSTTLSKKSVENTEDEDLPF